MPNPSLNLSLSLTGDLEASERLKRIARGTAALDRGQIVVGTRRPYGYGIETGFHRKSGKLARKAGGAQMLHRGVAEMQAGASTDIGEGLNRVSAPGPWILLRLARWALRLARLYTPEGALHDVHPGQLRKSLHIERGRR